MTEESQQSWDEDQERSEDIGGEEGPPVTEGGGTWDPAQSEEGHEGSAGEEPGDPGREA
jgi:hypothetical protein